MVWTMIRDAHKKAAALQHTYQMHLSSLIITADLFSNSLYPGVYIFFRYQYFHMFCHTCSFRTSEMLRDRGPKTLRLCTLLDKPERRVVDVHVDYTGFEIGVMMTSRTAPLSRSLIN